MRSVRSLSGSIHLLLARDELQLCGLDWTSRDNLGARSTNSFIGARSADAMSETDPLISDEAGEQPKLEVPAYGEKLCFL